MNKNVLTNEPVKFYMVKGNGPAFTQHQSQWSAEQEAMRLAKHHPGQCFFVMEAVSYYQSPINVQKVEF